MNRREFLRLSGLASIAAGLGIRPKAPEPDTLLGVPIEETNLDEPKTVLLGPVPAPVPVAAPPREVPGLATLLMENSIVRPRATIVPMGAIKKRHLGIPGVNATGYEEVILTAHPMVAFMQTSNEVPNPEPIIRQELAAAAAWTEDRAFLFGNGWGKPLGAARSPATIAVPRRRRWRILHKFGPAIVRKDIENMVERYSFSGNNPVWFVSMNAWPDVERLVSDDGALYGWPVVLTDMQPQRGYYGDVMLCDWSFYVIGDRGATIESADHVRFDPDPRDWRIVDRIDGKPWVTEPVDGRSPFVVLGGRPWADSGPAPDEPPEGWMDERGTV